MQDYTTNDILGLGFREGPRDNRKNPNRFEADHVAHRSPPQTIERQGYLNHTYSPKLLLYLMQPYENTFKIIPIDRDWVQSQSESVCLISSKVFTHSVIHFVVCHTTGSWALPKQVLHRVRSTTSSFNSQYPLFPLWSSKICLRLRPLPPKPFYPSFHLSFNNVFQKAVSTLDMTKTASILSLYCTQDIPLPVSH